ncbi:16220_t:CDS:2, partial [Racocetra fulgida]
ADERINHGPTLVIHGGAGVINRTNFPESKQKEYIDALKESLLVGYEVLRKGGSSFDAVVASVIVLEDCPFFNAGKGSVFTISGKDPENPHVFLGGIEAEKYAKSKGLEMVDPGYFWTKHRWKQHLDGLEKKELIPENLRMLNNLDNGDSSDIDPNPIGTVGAVAVDINGIISTATSTGGFNNKKDGRIGDTPLIACGTWADNETCGVSGTGNGEFFIRHSVAYDVAARMKYLEESVQDSASNVIENLSKVGGSGGVIALDKYGNCNAFFNQVAMPFNTEGMFRGYIRISEGIPYAYIFED